MRILLVTLLGLVGCGQFNREWKCSVEGNECEVTDKQGPSDGEDDGDERVGPRGPAGRDGQKGDRGSDGTACSVEQIESGQNKISCSDGTEVTVVDGAPGQDGVGCSVTQAVNGALIECASGSVLVLNGQDGADAPPTAYTVVGLVDPCGDKPGIYDEVFLRLQNGILIASFSDTTSGKNTRFSILTPGNYQVTDGSNCYFSVDSNLQIINEHY